jgi:acetyl-CoA carboxylase biotin carboxyl carrier protein
VARYEAKTEVTGSVWKIVTTVGQKLEPGDTLMIVESMKMEIPVIAEEGGSVAAFLVEEGQSVAEGDAVALLET